MNDRYKLRDIVGDDQRLKRFDRFMDPAGLVVGGNITPHWMRDRASFWYAAGSPHDTAILRVDGETGKVAPLFDVVKTRKALAVLLGRDLPYKGLPFNAVVELGDDRYQFSFEGTDYVLSKDSYVIEAAHGGSAVSRFTGAISRASGVDLMDREVPRSYSRPTLFRESILATEAPSPDKCWFASLKDGNIMLRAPADDRTVPLTTDGTPDFAWDIEAPRLKMTAGMQVEQHLLDPWSPDGNRLFAIRADRRAVPDFPLVRYLKREQELCTFKMQRAGGPMDIAHPHIIDVLAKRARRFDLGDTEDQFFTLIGWLPDGSEVLFTRHSRDFKTVDVLAGNPVDGSVRTILSESAKTFVALQHDVIFFGDNHVTVLSDGSGLIWRSARSGWNHLYLYALDGTLTRALTQGDFPVIDVVAVDQDGGWVYFTAHHDQHRPYDAHLCRVKFTDDEIQRLTPLDGQNVVSISPGKKTFTVVNSRPDRPFRTDFHACEGKHLAAVQQADVAALEALGHVASEEFTVTAADGETVLWGVIHKPADFDPKKKYPVIDHLYGAPQMTMVAHDFGMGEHSQPRLDRALAQLGYIVISVDARGTPKRSKAFQDVVYRNWGRHEIPDHVATLEQLAKRYAFIDLNRVGVWGHSWGGYFTIRALAQAPEVFHVGVAVAPSADPYDSILYEPYLDLPTRAKAAYDYANLYPWAGRITGNLMLLVGTSDPNCHSSTLKMAHSLIQAGIDHELVVLPEGDHFFLGKNEDYFVRKLVKHFEVHLSRRRSADAGVQVSPSHSA
jgi:dipeptidyl aminopeptidase/acylaminoacyl peptidase